MRGLATIPRQPGRRSTPPHRRGRDARILAAARPRLGRGVASGPPDGKEWIRKRELATHLKMTTRWIETQQRLGMPFLPCGTANRYRISEVEEWLRSRYDSAGDTKGRE